MTALKKAQTDAALKAIDADKESLAEVLTEVFAPKTTVSHSEAPAKLKTVAMTEAHKAAIERLPEVYALVTPEVPRMLNDEELASIVDERTVIDSLLTLLKKRKDDSIREALAYHLDKVAEAEGTAGPESETDKNGHYYVRQEVSVDGTGKKVQRIVSDPTPQVSSALLLELYEEGVLTRKEYLDLTSVPTVARNFDEAKARKAIRKDPALMTKIAQAVTRPNPTITIKVANDN